MSSAAVSFPFGVFVVSVTSTKLLHLFIHASSIPTTSFLLYLPTFFIPDLLVLCTARLLLRRERGLATTLGLLVGLFFTMVTFVAASSQIGFWWKTGGEMEWEQASTYASSSDGMSVLLSESLSVLLAGTSIVIAAWFTKFTLYKLAGDFLILCGYGFLKVFIWTTTKLGIRKAPQPDLESYTDSITTDYSIYHDNDSEIEALRSEASSFLGDDEKVDDRDVDHSIGQSTRYLRNKLCCVPAWATTTGILIFLTVTLMCRPIKPYVHMSTTLPIPLMDVWKAKPDVCAERTRLSENEWPLLELMDKKFWEHPSKTSKGWAPGNNNNYIKKYRETIPDWMPAKPPLGFHRWDPSQRHNITVADVASKGITPNNTEKIENKCPDVVIQDDDYNPVDDPLKISNLDLDIINPLRQALKDSSAKITHVALIQMESLREELFPIVQGSDIHKMILDTHDESKWDEVNEKLSKLTPNTEKITGKFGRFTNSNGSAFPPAPLEWDDKTEPGMGGINILGALTPASVSTKSVVGSHCGVWPMAVDFLEEAETQAYQPCLPQIFELFNANRDNESDASDIHNRKWEQLFFQAVTDGYDRQDVFNKYMGFKHVVTKTELEKDAKDDDSIKEINYFGYPETALKGYMENHIKNATRDNQRLFFSHFTSTTHHPWETPDWWNSTSYMGNKGFKNHEDFDKYLNTIRFHDAWLGEMLQMFDDLGLSDETLFVFVGDHGQAFKEDVSKTGTFENGHISNFRVPIMFRHPKLPRVQYEANATSLSIIPTVLDLLANTGSLNKKDSDTALDLAQDYEGQSLIRPYRESYNGRRAWNFGIVNSGGGILTVTSADAPWRLVMPLDKEVEYSFTDLEHDPHEKQPLKKWTIEGLIYDVDKKFGPEAADWADEAELVAKWWSQERKRLWKYAPGG